MNTNALKITVLCAAVLCASAARAEAKDDASAGAAHLLSEAARPCAPQEFIDRGWEQQFDLLDARLAIKDPSSLRVPGAIITPPFDDATTSVNSRAKTQRSSARAASQHS